MPIVAVTVHVFMHTHTHLEVTASTKIVDRASELRYLQKQAAMCICTCVVGEPTIVLWPLRFPAANAFPVCLCGGSFTVVIPVCRLLV